MAYIYIITKLTSAGDLLWWVANAAEEVRGEPVSVLLCLPAEWAAPSDDANLGWKILNTCLAYKECCCQF